jgi:4-alpha-glucanotransferase
MIGNARCRLAIIPVEDALGLEEQPNLPGTIDEHPNWRRRLPPTATLTEGDAARRLGILDQARKR